MAYRIDACECVGQDGDEDYKRGNYSAQKTNLLRSYSLVSNKVFDSAAKHVMRIGPKTG